VHFLAGVNFNISRLDFQTMDGFALVGTTSECTDTLVVKGSTGVDPPTICGINTGYHSMYRVPPD
jgi:hypothetical protein